MNIETRTEIEFSWYSLKKKFIQLIKRYWLIFLTAIILIGIFEVFY
jgi:hypothetical protein